MSLFYSNPPAPSAQPAEADARLKQINTWVFDLDNTLYPPRFDLFGQIDRKMKHFIAESLGLAPEDAFILQKRYLHEYGTTLSGLMKVHDMEPDAFLAYVHDIDHSVLPPDAALDAALADLPGRKLIFTNGTVKHATDVLDRLGIARHFEDIFDIRAADFTPKPRPETYARMLERHRVRAETSAMFEDLARNLVPAHALGMLTVLVQPEDAAKETEDSERAHIHYRTDDLALWLAQWMQTARKT